MTREPADERSLDPAEPGDQPGVDPETTDSPGPVEPVEPADSADATDAAEAPTPKDDHPSVVGSVAGSTWVGLSIGAVTLVLLLVFILQNQDSVRLQMFVWEWNFPIGVGMLIAAIAGALVMASVGAVRIIQLRRQISHPKNGGDGAEGKSGFFKRRG